MKDESAKALQAETMVSYSVLQVGWLLYSSHWTLLINKTSLPFWTSDNPVALYNPIDYSNKSGIGFAVRGIQIHLPINSELLLLVLDPTSYNLSAVKIIKKPEQITDENEIQLYNATRFVISSDADFSLAKRMREEDEILRKPQERVILRKVALSGRSII